MYNSTCITSIAPTLLNVSGLKSENMAEGNSSILKLKQKKIGDKNIDRIVIYNPDAIGLWLYQKYTDFFVDDAIVSDIAVPTLSVMPSVTPVCFASMYTGVMPEIHGIKEYVKPVLKQTTIFDEFIKAGKKCAIVSTEGDSISKIFLEREMDYYIYPSEEEVNEKAFELIEKDIYDVLVIYNGNYDGTMHGTGPESEKALNVLRENIETYSLLSEKIESSYKNHNVLYGFCPDHGCHKIDGGYGSHGLDMEQDMNIIHFFTIKKL